MAGTSSRFGPLEIQTKQAIYKSYQYFEFELKKDLSLHLSSVSCKSYKSHNTRDTSEEENLYDSNQNHT